MNDEIGKRIATFFMIAIATLVIGSIMALPTMWLWNNCLVDAVSGINQIGFLQAWGLLVLIGLFRAQVKPSKTK